MSVFVETLETDVVLVVPFSVVFKMVVEFPIIAVVSPVFNIISFDKVKIPMTRRSIDPTSE